LKAIDIINFINEDKFSKYTANQIYDELGEEDYNDYIEKICTKVVRNLKTDTEIKNAKPKINFNEFGGFWMLSYRATTGHLREDINIAMGSLIIHYDIGSSYTDYKIIGFDSVNVGVLLGEAISKLYKAPKAKRERARLGSN
jgi:hypothetical protein